MVSGWMTIDTSIDNVSLAQLLLDNSDGNMSVFVVQCGGDKVGWMPKAVRRSIYTAIAYCQVTWGVTPQWTDPGYWRKELEDGSGVVIEVFEMALEP